MFPGETGSFLAADQASSTEETLWWCAGGRDGQDGLAHLSQDRKQDAYIRYPNGLSHVIFYPSTRGAHG